MTKAVDVVLAKGDGIGPEISQNVIEILDAAGAKINFHEVILGGEAFALGYEDGIEPGAVEKMKQYGLVLKAPLATPSGGGHESVNVMLRRELKLWANVRPVTSIPFFKSQRDDMDLTLIRENTEGMYVGLTDILTPEAAEALTALFGQKFAQLGCETDGSTSFGVQIISDKASTRIVQAAFDFARANGCANVVGLSKPNILKSTDGRFRDCFAEVAAATPEVASKFMIIDAGLGDVVAYPKRRGVVVTQNLYGDVGSDVLAMQAHGSLGLAPSANIGGDRENPIAMFEAVHGTAPDIAGQGKANPTAFLISSLMMLRFVGQSDVALRIHNALLHTWARGEATGDIVYTHGTRGSCGAQEFTDQVISNLDAEPLDLVDAGYMRDDYRSILPAPVAS